MFNLSRYFSTLSFILIVLAAGVLGPLYQKLSLQQMQELAEGRNVAMAQVFRNSYGPLIEALVQEAVGKDMAALRHSESAGQLHGETLALLRGTAVIKIRLYNRVGNLIFTSDEDQSGGNSLDKSGFRAALRGVVGSELTHMSKINGLEGALSEVDVLSTYVPIPGKDGAVEGAFEFCQDVTPFVR